MLGLVVAGRPVDMSPSLTETGKLLFTIPSPETVNHFSLFLTEPLEETGQPSYIIDHWKVEQEAEASLTTPISRRINICRVAESGQR